MKNSLGAHFLLKLVIKHLYLLQFENIRMLLGTYFSWLEMEK